MENTLESREKIVIYHYELWTRIDNDFDEFFDIKHEKQNDHLNLYFATTHWYREMRLKIISKVLTRPYVA